MNYEKWLDWDGQTVHIDGDAYLIRCRVVNAISPYPHSYVDVWAEMVDKDSPAYLTVKERVGGSWGISLLQFHTVEELDRLCDVEKQLIERELV
jgi:hypothetical protein